MRLSPDEIRENKLLTRKSSLYILILPHLIGKQVRSSSDALSSFPPLHFRNIMVLPHTGSFSHMNHVDEDELMSSDALLQLKNSSQHRSEQLRWGAIQTLFLFIFGHIQQSACDLSQILNATLSFATECFGGATVMTGVLPPPLQIYR